VVVREAAASCPVHEHGHARPFGQRRELLRRVVPVDAAARHDHRSLRAGQQRGQLQDRRLIGGGGSPVGIGGRDRRHPILDRSHEQIDRDLDEDRPRPAGERVPDGGGEHLGDLARLGDRPRALGDRPQQIDLLDLLERAETAQPERGRAPDEEHRAAGGVGIGDAGDRVGDARARGDQGHADVAGEARVGVGGVGAGLLVAHVHHLHALGDAAVVDRQDVAAAEGEHVAHARLAQGARDQVPSVEIPHASRPACPGCAPPRASPGPGPRRRPRSSPAGTPGTPVASRRAAGAGAGP